MSKLKLKEFQLEIAVRFIVQASNRLKCSIRTRSKALIIYHQFKRCTGELEYSPSLLAAACMSLSVKLNGEDIELDAIMQAFFSIMDGIRRSIDSSDYKVIKDSVFMMECIILRMIDCDLNHRLAHEYLVYFLFDIHQELEAMEISYEVIENCLKITSDFYLSNRCLNYKAEEITSSAIQVAFTLIGVDIEDCSPYFQTWFKHLKENSKKEDIFEDFFRTCVIMPEAERRCIKK